MELVYLCLSKLKICVNERVKKNTNFDSLTKFNGRKCCYNRGRKAWLRTVDGIMMGDGQWVMEGCWVLTVLLVRGCTYT